MPYKDILACLKQSRAMYERLTPEERKSTLGETILKDVYAFDKAIKEIAEKYGAWTDPQIGDYKPNY